MFDEHAPTPLASAGLVPPVGPPRTAVAAATPPYPPRRYYADSSVQRRPWPLLLVWWLKDVVQLQTSLSRRAAVSLFRSLKHGQPCHPDWLQK